MESRINGEAYMVKLHDYVDLFKNVKLVQHLKPIQCNAPLQWTKNEN